MPNLEVKAAYTCTQQELYSGGANVISNCAALLANFAIRFKVYTPQYIASVQQKLTNAQSLPDFQSRDSVTEILGGKVKEKLDRCLVEVRFLKSYIEQAFENDPTTMKAKIEAAGFNYYAKAAAGNGEAGLNIVQNSLKFLELPENQEALKNYMPDSFIDAFRVLVEEYKTVYMQKPVAEQTKKGATITKIEANNLAYADIVKICDNGKLVFADDPINYPKFVWETVVKLVGGEKSTKLQGYVKDKETDLPLEGTTIDTTDGVYKKVTDSDGRFEFAQITGGAHTFIITKAGYIPQTIELNLETGVTKNLTVLLDKVLP